MLVAVYGSLRKTFYNHRLLENKDSKYIGTFQTKPIYTMKSLDSFPALLKKGSTSITLEVYKVSEKVDKNIETLEGYAGTNNEGNLYNKEVINTPFGKASIYFWNTRNDKDNLKNRPTCLEGDWKEYKLQLKTRPHA